MISWYDDGLSDTEAYAGPMDISPTTGKCVPGKELYVILIPDGSAH